MGMQTRRKEDPAKLKLGEDASGMTVHHKHTPPANPHPVILSVAKDLLLKRSDPTDPTPSRQCAQLVCEGAAGKHRRECLIPHCRLPQRLRLDPTLS